jgi:hypothetical protein
MSPRALSSQPKTSPATPRLLLPDGWRLQRKCACRAARNDNEESCAECQRTKVQKRSAVGASDFAFEREADRVAEDVLHPSPAARNSPAQVRRLPSSDGQSVPTSVDSALRLNGQSLKPTVRCDMEKRLGYDFSAVRIPTDEAAQCSAQELDAHAYTVDRDVAFGAGQFSPGTSESRGLLAHELTHVVQQGAAAGGTSTAPMQLKPDPKKDAKEDKGQATDKKKALEPNAASAPKLKVTQAKNVPPCACLMFVHTEERNAHKTAELMRTNCSYNLAMVNPDNKDRAVTLPGRTTQGDPNSLFSRAVAESCLDDELLCRDFVAKNAGDTNWADIGRVVETQFFLAVDDCSARFTLPVVVLHNNEVEDTKNYLKNKDKKGVSDLKLDLDKSSKETGEDQIGKLKGLIRTKFGDGVVKAMMETPRKTNIFRWYASSDLSHYHIGDPDHPDNITWVTNETDYATLSKKNLNVVLQSDAPASKKSESEGDLSTLFLILREILKARLPKIIAALEHGQDLDRRMIDSLLDEIRKIFQFGDPTFDNVLEQLREIVDVLLDILKQDTQILLAPSATQSRIDKLRFLNIQTPSKNLTDQSDAERVRNYESIVEVLQSVGLHCRGTDPKKAETSVKEGLKKK